MSFFLQEFPSQSTCTEINGDEGTGSDRGSGQLSRISGNGRAE